MDRNSLIGNWDAGFREFSIENRAGQLVLRCPEAPPGYESRLSEVEEGHFRVEGGPFDGAEVVLAEDGAVSLGGHVALSRLDRDAAAVPGSGLEDPVPDPGPEEEEAFEHLWNSMAHPSRAAEVDLGGFSMAHFVHWLTTRNLAVFHGTSRIDAEELEPAPWPTVTIGPAPAEPYVYGADDGFCAMFMALMDEVSARTGRHGVDRFANSHGSALRLYRFALGRDALSRRPFTAGALYLLPREAFSPVALYPGGPPTAEWICPEPVRPLARLIVTPDDFPFLDRVGPAD